MSENVKIRVEVENAASTNLRRISADMDRLSASMKKLGAIGKIDLGGLDSKSAKEQFRAAAQLSNAKLAGIKRTMAAETRFANQRRREERASLAAVKATNAFTIRMARQEAAEVANVARVRRQADQEASSAIRERSRLSARADREEERRQARLGRAGSRVATGFSRVGTVGAVAAGAVTGGAAAGIRSLGRSAVTLDTSEILAAVHVFTTETVEASLAKARDLRNDALSRSIKLGLKPSDLIGGTVEAAQAGVPAELLEMVTELGVKYSKLMGTNLPETLEQAGKSISVLRGLGRLDGADGVRRFFNTTAGLAGQTAASRQEMLSFARTGVGAGAQAGMSVEGTLAFGAAMTSVGMQGQQASRLLNRLPQELAEWSMKAKDIRRQHHRSEEDRLFLQAPQMLGFSNFEQIESQFKADPDSFLYEILGRLRKIADPVKRMQVKKSLLGNEFGQFISSAAESKDVNLETLSLAKRLYKQSEEQDYLTTSWKKWATGLTFFLDQISATAEALKAELGDVLKPYADDLRSYITETASSFAGLKATFSAGLSGLTNGLLGHAGTFRELLTTMFGAPGSGGLNPDKVRAFARGIGDGLREIGSAIGALFRGLSGGSGDPEAMGRWATRFLTWSAAMKAAEPGLAILKSFGEIVLGLAGGLTAIRGILGLTGKAGAAGAAACAGTSGIGLLLSRMFTLGIVAEIGSNRAQISAWLVEGTKSLVLEIVTAIRKGLTLKGLLSEITPAPVQRWLRKAPKEEGSDGPDSMVKALRDNTIQLQSFTSDDGLKGLIHRTSYAVDRLTDRLADSGGRVFLASGGSSNGAQALGSSVGGTTGGGGGGGRANHPLNEAVPGSSISGLGGNGIIRRSPGGARRGGGGGRAGGGDGAGDPNQPGQPINGPLQGLPGEAAQQFANILGKRESGNRYGIRNSLGFSGRWQMGAGALIDTGYVRRGTTNRGLANPSNWLGKGGITSLDQFLANQGGVQDTQFREYTNQHYNQLVRAGVIKPGMTPAQVAGALAMAHLGGVGAAINYSRGGGNFRDANGTPVSSYYQMMRGVGTGSANATGPGLAQPAPGAAEAGSVPGAVKETGEKVREFLTKPLDDLRAFHTAVVKPMTDLTSRADVVTKPFSTMQDIADKVKATKPADVVPPTPADAIRNIPSSRGSGSSGDGSSGSDGPTYNVTQHISSPHNPETIARLVNKHIQDEMRLRSHDVDFATT